MTKSEFDIFTGCVGVVFIGALIWTWWIDWYTAKINSNNVPWVGMYGYEIDSNGDEYVVDYTDQENIKAP